MLPLDAVRQGSRERDAAETNRRLTVVGGAIDAALVDLAGNTMAAELAKCKCLYIRWQCWPDRFCHLSTVHSSKPNVITMAGSVTARITLYLAFGNRRIQVGEENGAGQFCGPPRRYLIDIVDRVSVYSDPLFHSHLADDGKGIHHFTTKAIGRAIPIGTERAAGAGAQRVGVKHKDVGSIAADTAH